MLVRSHHFFCELLEHRFVEEQFGHQPLEAINLEFQLAAPPIAFDLVRDVKLPLTIVSAMPRLRRMSETVNFRYGGQGVRDTAARHPSARTSTRLFDKSVNRPDNQFERHSARVLNEKFRRCECPIERDVYFARSIFPRVFAIVGALSIPRDRRSEYLDLRGQKPRTL
jgi:hypothetical protein